MKKVDFNTRFQSVVLTGNKVLIFLEKLEIFRFFKSTGILSQRAVAEKATVCFPELAHCLG